MTVSRDYGPLFEEGIYLRLAEDDAIELEEDVDKEVNNEVEVAKLNTFKIRKDFPETWIWYQFLEEGFVVHSFVKNAFVAQFCMRICCVLIIWGFQVCIVYRLVIMCLSCLKNKIINFNFSWKRFYLNKLN